MVLIAAVPSYVLGRWFDRQPERATVTAPSVAGVQGFELAAGTVA